MHLCTLNEETYFSDTTKCNFIFNMAFAPLCTCHHYSTMHKILQVTRKNMSNKESGPLILQSHIVTYDIKKNHFVLTFDRSNTLKRTCIVPSYMVEVKMISFLFSGFLFLFVFVDAFLEGQIFDPPPPLVHVVIE